jgi:hypothetical protein
MALYTLVFIRELISSYLFFSCSSLNIYPSSHNLLVHRLISEGVLVHRLISEGVLVHGLISEGAPLSLVSLLSHPEISNFRM